MFIADVAILDNFVQIFPTFVKFFRICQKLSENFDKNFDKIFPKFWPPPKKSTKHNIWHVFPEFWGGVFENPEKWQKWWRQIPKNTYENSILGRVFWRVFFGKFFRQNPENRGSKVIVKYVFFTIFCVIFRLVKKCDFFRKTRTYDLIFPLGQKNDKMSISEKYFSEFSCTEKHGRTTRFCTILSEFCQKLSKIVKNFGIFCISDFHRFFWHFFQKKRLFQLTFWPSKMVTFSGNFLTKNFIRSIWTAWGGRGHAFLSLNQIFFSKLTLRTLFSQLFVEMKFCENDHFFDRYITPM